MSRRMVAPGVWVDEGPRESHSTYATYASRPAAVVGGMVPILKAGVCFENRKRTRKGRSFSIHPENRL